MTVATSAVAVDLPAGTVARADTPSARRVGRRVLLAMADGLATMVVILVVWELAVSIFHFNSYLVHSPAQVWRYVIDPHNGEARHELLAGARITLRDAGLGLLSGTAAGLVLAVAFNLWRSIEQAVLPVALALRCVPLVAMTPLIEVTFGRGVLTITIIAGIVTFFPTLINVSLALRSAPSASVDLLRAYGASPLTRIRKLQLPTALPALFASIRIAAPLAMLGATLAEWLSIGNGLGNLMATSSAKPDFDTLWAAVALVTFASVFVYTAVSAVEEVVLARFAPEQSRAKLT